MDPLRLAESWAGVVGAIVGLSVIEFAPIDDLLPVNQLLLALDCALLAVWATLAVTTHRGRGS